MTTVSELLNRTAVRFSIIFAMLIALTVLAGVAVIYWQLSARLEEHIKLRVLETRDALVQIDANEGFKELTDVVRGEAAARRDIDSILMLTDQTGAFVAGNVDGVAPFTQWRTLKETDLHRQLGRANPEDSFFAQWVPLSEGGLLIGGSDRDLRQVKAALLGGMLWGLAALVVVAAGIGGLVARRAQSQIDAISNALSAVSDGKLDHRVARHHSGDDLDRVAVQINTTLDTLQRLIARVNQSSNDIAHDLKRPIGRIRQKLDVALRTATSVPAFQREIDASIQELDIIVETFEALLRITQIEAGARRERFRVLQLDEVVGEVIEIYQPVVSDTGGTLTADLPADLHAAIDGDHELLIQLFVNLVENAVRHCPSGTRIVVSLRQSAEGCVAIVADDGPGIPAEERDKVFDRLYRLEKSRSTPGSGLGLSLVAAIAELHGAAIVLGDNCPGLRVEIVFPRAVTRVA